MPRRTKQRCTSVTDDPRHGKAWMDGVLVLRRALWRAQIYLNDVVHKALIPLYTLAIPSMSAAFSLAFFAPCT